MSLSKCYQQWSLNDLKDKEGNQPPPNIFNFIKKLDRNSLLPCPRTANDLAMPKSATTPREMNSFIVFRRQLAHVAKTNKISDDGKVLSRAASYIWNGASKNEKESYRQIAKELKTRHYQMYPTYTYERRKRNTAEEDFIFIDADTIRQTKKKARKPTPQTSAESSPIQALETECSPSSIPLQEQVSEEWFNPHNPLTLYDTQAYADTLYFGFGRPDRGFDYTSNQINDNNKYGLVESDHSLSDDMLPQVIQMVMAQNYANLSNQEFQLQSEALSSLQQPEQLSPQSSILYGDCDAGMNQESDIFALQRSIDDFIVNQSIN